jgi:hypothetical protein
MYRFARAARIYDGPDEVHRQSVARQVLRGYEAPADGVPSEHLPDAPRARPRALRRAARGGHRERLLRRRRQPGAARRAPAQSRARQRARRRCWCQAGAQVERRSLILDELLGCAVARPTSTGRSAREQTLRRLAIAFDRVFLASDYRAAAAELSARARSRSACSRSAPT